MHGSGMPGSRTEQGGTGKGLRVPSSRCFSRQECRGGGCYGKKESDWFFMAVANGWASERAVLAAHGGSQPLPHAGRCFIPLRGTGLETAGSAPRGCFLFGHVTGTHSWAVPGAERAARLAQTGAW